MIDVDDPGRRIGVQRHLVHVSHRGQPGTDVDQLPDARLMHQVTDHPAHEGAVNSGRLANIRQMCRDRSRGFPVGRVIIFAAEEVVVNARRTRNVRSGMWSASHRRPRARPGPPGLLGFRRSFTLGFLSSVMRPSRAYADVQAADPRGPGGPGLPRRTPREPSRLHKLKVGDDLLSDRSVPRRRVSEACFGG